MNKMISYWQNTVIFVFRTTKDFERHDTNHNYVRVNNLRRITNVKPNMNVLIRAGYKMMYEVNDANMNEALF